MNARIYPHQENNNARAIYNVRASAILRRCLARGSFLKCCTPGCDRNLGARGGKDGVNRLTFTFTLNHRCLLRSPWLGGLQGVA